MGGWARLSGPRAGNRGYSFLSIRGLEEKATWSTVSESVSRTWTRPNLPPSPRRSANGNEQPASAIVAMVLVNPNGNGASPSDPPSIVSRLRQIPDGGRQERQDPAKARPRAPGGHSPVLCLLFWCDDRRHRRQPFKRRAHPEAGRFVHIASSARPAHTDKIYSCDPRAYALYVECVVQCMPSCMLYCAMHRILPLVMSSALHCVYYVLYACLHVSIRLSVHRSDSRRLTLLLAPYSVSPTLITRHLCRPINSPTQDLTVSYRRCHWGSRPSARCSLQAQMSMPMPILSSPHMSMRIFTHMQAQSRC